MTTLTKASAEWSRRSIDERCSSLEELHSRASAQKRNSRSATIRVDAIEAFAHNGEASPEVRIRSKGNETGAGARITYSAFQQLCARANAPSDYLARLPAEVAAKCLNTSMAQQLEKEPGLRRLALIRAGEVPAIHAFNSTKYGRIFNADITERLCRLAGASTFQPAPAGFDGSRGLYLGERDMFAFLVDNNRRIFEKDPNGGLSRGFFVWNSETGHRKIGGMHFHYNYVCGNHMVWGATNVFEWSARHIGNIGQRFEDSGFIMKLAKWSEGSASEDERVITAARSKEYATKEDMLDAIFGLRVPELNKKTLELAYTRAVQHADWYGSPRSIWGITNGITEIARDEVNADSRVALELAGSKVMALAA